MNRLLIVSLFALFTSASVIAEESVSDERISEISQRLETYSSDKLIERRDFLVSYQEGDEQEDSDGVPAGSVSERAIEISIIEEDLSLSASTGSRAFTLVEYVIGVFQSKG